MKIKKTEVKKLFTEGGETKASLTRVAKEILTVGVAVPYLAWFYIVLTFDAAMIGNVALLDVLLAIYTGVCIYKKYIKRDPNETLKSRVSCIIANIVKLVWIACYIWGSSFLIMCVGRLIQFPIITLIVAVIVKCIFLKKIEKHIEPNKQIVSLCETSFFVEDDDDAEDTEDESIA